MVTGPRKRREISIDTMGKDDFLNVTAFSFDGVEITIPQSQLGFSTPGDGTQLKVLRHKTLVLEWSLLTSVQTMTTQRTKIEVSIASMAQATVSDTITITLHPGHTFAGFCGTQGFDYAKRQRAKCTWQTTAWAGVSQDLRTAAASAQTLTLTVSNQDKKVQRIMADVLQGAGKPPAAKATPARKRPAKVVQPTPAAGKSIKDMLMGVTPAKKQKTEQVHPMEGKIEEKVLENHCRNA